MITVPGGLVKELRKETSVPYEEIPGFPEFTVERHSGQPDRARKVPAEPDAVRGSQVAKLVEQWDDSAFEFGRLVPVLVVGAKDLDTAQLPI